MGEARIAGSLVLTGPGARRVPIRLSSRGHTLRVELLGHELPPTRLSAALARRAGAMLETPGVTVEVVAGPFRVLELGRPGRPYRPYAAGVLYLAVRSAAGRAAGAVRSLFRR